MLFYGVCFALKDDKAMITLVAMQDEILEQEDQLGVLYNNQD